MSGEPGWYPDPGGAPDRYRYWDGQTWSTESSDDPRRQAPPSVTGGRGASGDPGSGRPHGSGPHSPAAIRWLVAVTVVAVLTAVSAVVLHYRDQAAHPPVLFPSASGPALGERTPSSTGTVPTESSLASRAIGCPVGAPDARGPHPADARVYGGNLSFPRVTSYLPEAPENRLTFAYDVTQQTRTVSLDPPWISQLAVGRLMADGYPRTAQHTAELVTECIVASDLYLPHRPTRRDLSSRLVTVSGQDGWLITTEILVDLPGLPFEGDRVAVLVVPDGADWSLFFGAVPIGDQALTDVLTRTVLALRVG